MTISHSLTKKDKSRYLDGRERPKSKLNFAGMNFREKTAVINFFVNDQFSEFVFCYITLKTVKIRGELKF